MFVLLLVWKLVKVSAVPTKLNKSVTLKTALWTLKIWPEYLQVAVYKSCCDFLH